MSDYFSALVGDTWSKQTYGITDFRSDSELIAQWGQVCRRTFKWQPGCGNHYEVYSAKCPTPSEANAQVRRLALECGYVAPKWWEFWRMGESPLPAEVSK